MNEQRTTPTQSPVSQLSKASQSFQQNPTILIVEDEPITAKVTRNTLDKLGYQSSVAKDGQQAIDKPYQQFVVIDKQQASHQPSLRVK